MSTITLNAGANLQAALDSAQPGDVLELEPGAVFVGNFSRAEHDITVRVIGADSLPPDTPMTAAGLATIRTPNSLPALRTTGNASRWRFTGIAFAGGNNPDDLVRLGDGLISDPTQLPTAFIFDRCLIQADVQAKNGIQANAAGVTLRHCAIRGVKRQGQESHAFIAYNTPGVILVEDCYLEAGSCGFFIGGEKPAIPNCVPADITFRRNTVTRPLEMHAQTGWVVKNLFELKNAQRVLASGNTFEHNWPDGQSGYAIVLTVRANSLTAPWTTIQDVLFESNIVRHVAMGFNILGLDNQVINGQTCPSQAMERVSIRNNLIYDLDRLNWKSPAGVLGSGAFMAIDGAPHGLAVENNTAVGDVTGNILSLTGPPIPGFVFHRNIVQKQTKAAGFPYDTYGIYGNAIGEGNAALATFAPDAVVTENVLAGCTAAAYSNHPDNLFPSVVDLRASFTDLTTENYRSWFGATLGIGCDQDAIETACQPAPPPPPPPPPEPTIAERILSVADAEQAKVVEFGGTWAPQDAAFTAIRRYCNALLAQIGED